MIAHNSVAPSQPTNNPPHTSKALENGIAILNQGTTKHMDFMPQIIRICRDAIADRLIRTETLRRFDRKVRTLKGNDLEDYIQNLWDQV